MEKILIADDLEKWHKVVERNMDYFGFKDFLHAYDIKKGLELYEAYKPNLVITDVNFDISNLENIDGLILCEQIRKQDKDTGIIVMSSRDNIEKMAMENGANYFINKKNFKEEIEDFIKKNYKIIIK